MNQLVLKTALFTRDLLEVDESIIKLGRSNMIVDNFTASQIVIDILGSVTVQTSSEKFDGVLESINYNNTQNATVTINFFGDRSYELANKFILLCKSEKKHTLENMLKLRVGIPKTITDVKLLTGTQYSEQYEVELNITSVEDIDITTLRIDIAQTQFLKD
jgi:hypothetical protein